jgi:hypothetical protein
MPPSVIPPSRAAAFLMHTKGHKSGNGQGCTPLERQHVSLSPLSGCTLERMGCGVTIIHYPIASMASHRLLTTKKDSPRVEDR